MPKNKTTVLCIMFFVILAGCKDNPQPARNNSQPSQDASSQAQASTSESGKDALVEQERHLALTDITTNFQLNEYSLTVAKSETQSGKWSVVPTTENCSSDETCFDVLFHMDGTSDVPGWHTEFDRATGMINRETDIDEDLNNKYFMVRPSSRGGADTRP